MVYSAIMALAELLRQTDSLKTELDRLRPLKPEQELRLLQKFRLEWNYHSNALEGNSITLGETEMFLLHGVTARGKPFKDYLDIKGHDKCISYLLDLARGKEPLTEAVIRELHSILLVEPYEVAAITPDGQPTKRLIKLGEYKSFANHVRTATGAIHYYATPEETPAKMGDLMGWLNRTVEEKKEPLLVVASLFHHRFTEIHPFDDGNGRMARLLMNLILMRDGFPPVVIKQETRQEYLQALREADQGTIAPLVELVSQTALRSLDLAVRAAKGEEVDELNDLDKKIALIKQQVQHVPDSVIATAEVENRVFKMFVLPALERITQKLSQLNGLFRVAQAIVKYKVHPTASRNSSANGEQTSTFEELIDQIESLRSTNAAVAKVGVTFMWLDYLKSPKKLASLSTTIEFHFDLSSYSYVCSNAPIHEELPYSSIPDGESRNELVRRFVDELLMRLSQNLGIS
jgi:Fic family protein